MEIIISLILIGLALMLIEILLIPGVGVVGILGVLSMVGSCYFTFVEYGTMVGLIYTGGVILLLMVIMIFVLRAKTWKRAALETNIDSKAVEDAAVAVGDRGKTVTRLAPMGSARFGNYVVEVKAWEGMMDPNVEVEVVQVEENRIYVKPIEL